MGSDMIIYRYHLTKLVKLFILEMVEKMRECSFKSRSHFGKTFHVNRSQQEVSEVYLEVQQNFLQERVLWEHGKQRQGPVVQSIITLTSSLRCQLVKCFTSL